MLESEALSGQKVLLDKFYLGLFNNELQYNVELMEHKTDGLVLLAVQEHQRKYFVSLSVIVTSFPFFCTYFKLLVLNTIERKTIKNIYNINFPRDPSETYCESLGSSNLLGKLIFLIYFTCLML